MENGQCFLPVDKVFCGRKGTAPGGVRGLQTRWKFSINQLLKLANHRIICGYDQ